MAIKPRLRFLALLLTVAVGGILGQLALAGFVGTILGDLARFQAGTYRVNLPPSSSGIGITQDASPLDPTDWYKYRVRVFHSDAQFPNLGWPSDEFDPTGETEEIRVCHSGISNCTVDEIMIGTEELDWSDESKITVKIQAKTCAVCAWNNFTVNWQ